MNDTLTVKTLREMLSNYDDDQPVQFLSVKENDEMGTVWPEINNITMLVNTNVTNIVTERTLPFNWGVDRTDLKYDYTPKALVLLDEKDLKHRELDLVFDAVEGNNG